MNNYDIEMTDENILLTINNDYLSRNKKLNSLINLLNNIEGNRIISVDGGWGSGKSIFLKQLEIMNRYNIFPNTFNSGFIKLFREKYSVYYYNAWQNDDHDEPLLSIIYNLINDYPSEAKQIVTEKNASFINVKEGLKTLTYSFIDIDKVKSFEDITSSIHTTEEKKKALEKIIDNILPDEKKLIILIDELDRCNPKFAIKMLEAIKHYYSNDRIIFIVATNNEQLSYTVSNYYGVNFDGYGYLNKLYDLIIELDEISVEDYLTRVIQNYNDNSYISVSLNAVCNFFKFQMREINRIVSDYDLLSEFMSTSRFSPFIDDDKDTLFKFVFLPFCLGLKIKSREKLTKFLHGELYDYFLEYINGNDGLLSIARHTFAVRNKIGVKNVVDSDLHQYLKDFYMDCFTRYINNTTNKKHKEYFSNMLSLMEL